MEYSDGRRIRAGDKVELWPGCRGVVVVNCDDHEVVPPYVAGDLEWAETGILIDSDCAGSIRIPSQDLIEDLKYLGVANDSSEDLRES
jgi:hypothetical protein